MLLQTLQRCLTPVGGATRCTPMLLCNDSVVNLAEATLSNDCIELHYVLLE